jgi:hypothetical protein
MDARASELKLQDQNKETKILLAAGGGTWSRSAEFLLYYSAPGCCSKIP